MRWVEARAEGLCCIGAHSVIEVTREVEILAGKDTGKHSVEKILYVSSQKMDPERAEWALGIIREYWSIEGCLHQRLDVSAGEDSSRVRNRNSLLVLGILRRSVMGIYEQWRRERKNKRQSTLKDFYDNMNAFNHRQAFSKLKLFK